MQKTITTITRYFYNSALIKNLCTYSLGNIILRIIPLTFTPFALTILSPDDYGLLSLANSFISITTIFIGMGLRQALYIEFFHKSLLEKKYIINDIIALYSVFSLPVLLMILIVSFYSSPLWAAKDNFLLIFISIIGCFLYFFTELFYQLLILKGNIFKLTTIQIGAAIFNVVSSVVLVYFCNWKAEGMLLAYVLSMAFSCLIGLYYYIQQSYKVYFNIKHAYVHIYYYLKAGTPFIPGMLCAWVLSSSSKWVLAEYTSLHEVGIYAIADTVGQLYQLVIIFPITNVYVPYLLKKFSENKDSIQKIELWNKKNMYTLLVALILLTLTGWSLCRILFMRFLPYKYHDAIQYMLLIVLGNIILSGTYFLSGIILFYKKIYFHVFSLFVPALLNVLFGLLLVPHYHIYGCIYGMLMAYVIYFFIVYFYNIRLIKMRLIVGVTQG